MAVKVQYPGKLQLAPTTKCPSCGAPVNSVEGNVYCCTGGHLIEAILLVSVRLRPNPRPAQNPEEAVKVQPGDRLEGGGKPV